MKMSIKSINCDDLPIKLKEQMTLFFDELAETYPSEGDFVVFRILIANQIEPQKIMNYVVNHILPYTKMVEERDEQFFLTNTNLFSNISQDKASKVNHFKRMWMSGQLTNDDKEAIWRWFNVFIAMARRYKELVNRPT